MSIDCIKKENKINNAFKLEWGVGGRIFYSFCIPSNN